MDPTDLTHENTISKLGSIVSDNSSIFNKCYKCFTVAMSKNEDVHIYVDIVKRLYISF